MNSDSLKDRTKYVASINKYIDKAKAKADRKRSSFVKNLNLKTAEAYRLKFSKMIGINSDPTSFNTKLISNSFYATIDGITVNKYCFSYKGIKHFGLLYQCGPIEKTPFVIGLHGGGGTPEIVGGIEDSENYNNFIKRIVNQGINVFCPQLLLWDKEKICPNNYNRQDIDAKLKQLGTSITALEMAEITAILNYFINFEKVNQNEIGIAGMSYGGMYALYLGAFDSRYKSVISSSFFNDRFAYSWTDWSYWKAALSFSDSEIAMLVAPRKLYISLGDHDCMFDVEKAKRLLFEVEQYFSNNNKSLNFKFNIFDGDHEFDKDDNFIKSFSKDIKG